MDWAFRDDDENEGYRPRNRSKLEKSKRLGDGEGSPGNNRKQNKQFDQACEAIEDEVGIDLSDDQKQRLHRDISGENLDFNGIRDRGIDMFRQPL